MVKFIKRGGEYDGRLTRNHPLHDRRIRLYQSKLAEVLDSRGITRNRLKELTGAKYDVITRYYKSKEVQMVDLDFFAKVCYVLDCKIEDLLEYQQPPQS